jgi:hypothetical protein
MASVGMSTFANIKQLTGSVSHGVRRHIVSRAPSTAHDEIPTIVDGGDTGALSPGAPFATESAQNRLAVESSRRRVRQVLVKVVLEIGDSDSRHAVKGRHVETQKHLEQSRMSFNKMPVTTSCTNNIP